MVHRRILAWEGCLNIRDLGGYPTAYGVWTRWGTVVRADTVSKLTMAGRAALLAYGVRTIVDLRLPHEVEADPSPYATPGEHDVAYHHISMIDPAEFPPKDFTTLADNYKMMLDRYTGRMAGIIHAIAHASPEGAVLLHCAGGKDRTGIAAALLLGAVRVPHDVIAADYALTAECLRPEWEETLRHNPERRQEIERELDVMMPRREVMLEMLDHLDRRYGGVDPYLRHIGLTDLELGLIQARLLGYVP